MNNEHITIDEAVNILQGWGEAIPDDWEDVGEVTDGTISRRDLDLHIELTIKERGHRVLQLEQAYNQWQYEKHDSEDECDRCRDLRARVRIVAPESGLRGLEGYVYSYQPGYPHPWRVRPDGWGDPCGGVCFTIDELELLVFRDK